MRLLLTASLFICLSPVLAFAETVGTDSAAPASKEKAPAAADTKAEPKEEKKLPKSGVLSSSIRSGYQSRNIGDQWGGTDITGDAGAAPITGSVSRVSPQEWVAKIFNNTDDTYSASLRVVQLGKRGSQTKQDSFSYTLKPHSSASRRLASSSLTEEARLELQGWKKLGAKKAAKETKAANVEKAPAATPAARVPVVAPMKNKHQP